VTGRVVPDLGPGVAYFGTVMRGPATEASARAHVVEQILDRVLSGWRAGRPSKDEDFAWLRDQASRAKTVLQRSGELAEKLGDNAPDMDAANLHPCAWENGRSFRNTGHYHQAVMQAAIRISAETQAKLGRMGVSETALFNEAFPSAIRSRGRLGYDLRRMTAARPTRTCTVGHEHLSRVSMQRSVIRGCMHRVTVARNSSR
jgi:hypothetical protein